MCESTWDRIRVIKTHREAIGTKLAGISLLNTPIRDGFLTNRSATNWNLLTPEIAEAESENSFKTKIYNQMKSDT